MKHRTLESWQEVGRIALMTLYDLPDGLKVKPRFNGTIPQKFDMREAVADAIEALGFRRDNPMTEQYIEYVEANWSLPTATTDAEHVLKYVVYYTAALSFFAHTMEVGK